jgi:ribosomal protein S18 acetylase RimI-like enzyme
MPVARLAAIAVRLMLQPRMIVQLLKEDATGRPVKHDSQEVVAVLTTLAVAASHRGLGVGRRLVLDLEQFFRKCNVRSYRLETLVANGPARAFYGGLGFVEVATSGSSVVLLKAVG